MHIDGNSLLAAARVSRQNLTRIDQMISSIRSDLNLIRSIFFERQTTMNSNRPNPIPNSMIRTCVINDDFHKMTPFAKKYQQEIK